MIIFFGPMPPPINGFSFITSQFFEALNRVGKVEVIDRTSYRFNNIPIVKYIMLLLSVAWKLSRVFILCMRRDVSAVYMGVSGGAGQLVEIPFLVLFGMFRKRLFLHHHTFQYLKHVQLYNQFYFKCARGDVVHIALCRHMGDLLSEVYDIHPSNIRVVSNVGFLPTPDSAKTSKELPVDYAQLRIGFLSNISRDKGIFLFFDVVERLMPYGLAVDAYIAGPLEQSIEDEFNARLEMLPQVEYLGPLYDEDKTNYLRNLDLLIFPSYLNEAEPVTILEAIGCGVAVIATGQGCVPGLELGKYSAVVDVGLDTLESIVCAVLQFENSRKQFEAYEVRRESVKAYQDMREKCQAELSQLVREICGDDTGAEV